LLDHIDSTAYSLGPSVEERQHLTGGSSGKATKMDRAGVLALCAEAGRPGLLQQPPAPTRKRIRGGPRLIAEVQGGRRRSIRHELK